MEESIRDFLESLREEVIHHKEKRATFVLQKLAFVAAFFGLGSIESEWTIKFHWLLFAVPFVSLAFDTYISAEDYKVKRIGTFCRIYRYATSCERNWERFVNQHREPIAVWASLALTLIATVASALVLWVQNSEVQNSTQSGWLMWVFWVWLPVVTVFTIIVFAYYPWLLRKLPSPHLLKEQTDELLAAPERMSSPTSLRDKAIIALMLNTGISPKEVVALEADDLDQALDGKPALRVRDGKGCKERLVPYREPSEVIDTVKAWKDKADIKEKDLLFQEPRPSKSPGRMKPGQVGRILKQYPIVIEGAIHSARPDELRRTYARRLYEDGIDLVTIQRYLGCNDIKPVLGYIGPIVARREMEREYEPSGETR